MTDHQLCGNVILAPAHNFIFVRSNVAVVKIFECGHFLTVPSKQHTIPQSVMKVQRIIFAKTLKPKLFYKLL